MYLRTPERTGVYGERDRTDGITVTPPKKVKVGPHDYVIEKMTTDLVQASNAVGACLEVESKIIYDPGQSQGQVRDTILHELLHAVWGQTYMDKKYDDNAPDSEGELMIHELAPRILALLRDNPALVKFLTEGDK